MKRNIACLPVAGTKNPYQYLMINGLNSNSTLFAYNGVDDRFMGIIKTHLKFKPDYIHFDWITSYYQRRYHWMTILLLPLFIFQVYYIKFFTKTKMVWTLHNILPHNAKRVFFHKLVRRWFAGQCEWIRVFSESSVNKAGDILHIPKNKIHIVPEGDYTSVYKNEISREESRALLEIPQSKKVLLYLGLLKPYKGIDKLIDIFNSIEDSELFLIIAGAPIDAAYSKFLNEKISTLNDTRILYKNKFIPENDLQVYFNASDLVVLPFEKVENSGSAIMAMGFKKAILAPKMGVLQKRLSYQKNLLFTNLGDTLSSAVKMNNNDLSNIGLKNYNYLKMYKWKDFSDLFKLTDENNKCLVTPS